jgi:tetratricopeptide (TPR) repeat protein
MSGSPRPSLRAVAAVVLVLATAAAYAPLLRADFITLDDPIYVLNNEHVTTGLTLANVEWAFRTGHAMNWHPITWISHMLDVEMFGLAPAGHHAMNVLLHAASAVLLLFALDRLTRAFWESVAVAALFALHPLHVESVAWIAERKDVLSGLFFALTLLAYARYVERPGTARYALVLVPAALGSLSKPTLVTLPFLLLLLDGWPLGRMRTPRPGKATKAGGRTRFGALVREKIPLFVLAAGVALATYAVQETAGAVSSLGALPLAARASNALVSYCRYLVHAVWPADLVVFYPHANAVQPVLATGSLLLLGFVSWIAMREREHRPWLITGWLWYLGTLLPMIGFVQVGEQAMADRYTYIPLIGIFLAVVFAASEALRARAWTTAAVALPVLAALGLCTRHLASSWRSSRTLFERATAIEPESSVAHFCLANVRQMEGDLDGAVRHAREGLRLSPYYPDAHKNLGLLLARAGRMEESVEELREARRVEPRSTEILRDLGFELARMGRTDEAIAQYRAALEADPRDVDAMGRIAWIRATHADPARRDAAEAVGLAERARGVAGEKNAVVHDILAAAYAEAGRFEDAVRACEKAVELAQGAGEEKDAARFREHLDLFRAGKPVRIR